MSAPVAVNTADGTCWTRRGALRGGEALYAPEGVCSCPELVMATLAELAEHGIVGSADALPMPAGPEPQMPPSQSAAIGELIGDAVPAADRLLGQLALSVRDVREHEHPKWEDLYCQNLQMWLGERMGPVLRRLLDAEARITELEAAPLAFAEQLDAKSLDNFLIALASATEHEPMNGAVDEIHKLIASYRETEPGADGITRRMAPLQVMGGAE
ncbi:hypothetical protein KVH15_33340 [Streptomyces olivaceus]|uniref:hypothetical protein n=1 Tax=Streptomyces olivaceus TaxID=47716 RepID=UPI001CC8FFFF|nr:hypothetical protein [Streptomyces olivaceus]MBZ6085869.1 hypothetical protein [Streptomyces olivaceus]